MYRCRLTDDIYTTHTRTHRSHAYPGPHTSIAVTLTAHTHATQTTVHASQSPQQPHSQHGVLRQPHKQTKDYYHHTGTQSQQ